MTRKTFTTGTALALVLLAGAPVLAAGNSNGTNTAGNAGNAAETQAMSQAKISLSDAANAAMQSQPGQVAEAALAMDNGQPVYAVTVQATDGTEHLVMVDAMTGKVISSQVEAQKRPERPERPRRRRQRNRRDR